MYIFILVQISSLFAPMKYEARAWIILLFFSSCLILFGCCFVYSFFSFLSIFVFSFAWFHTIVRFVLFRWKPSVLAYVARKCIKKYYRVLCGEKKLNKWQWQWVNLIDGVWYYFISSWIGIVVYSILADGGRDWMTKLCICVCVCYVQVEALMENRIRWEEH